MQSFSRMERNDKFKVKHDEHHLLRNHPDYKGPHHAPTHHASAPLFKGKSISSHIKSLPGISHIIGHLNKTKYFNPVVEAEAEADVAAKHAAEAVAQFLGKSANDDVYDSLVD